MLKYVVKGFYKAWKTWIEIKMQKMQEKHYSYEIKFDNKASLSFNNSLEMISSTFRW